MKKKIPFLFLSLIILASDVLVKTNGDFLRRHKNDIQTNNKKIILKNYKISLPYNLIKKNKVCNSNEVPNSSNNLSIIATSIICLAAILSFVFVITTILLQKFIKFGCGIIASFNRNPILDKNILPNCSEKASLYSDILLQSSNESTYRIDVSSNNSDKFPATPYTNNSDSLKINDNPSTNTDEHINPKQIHGESNRNTIDDLRERKRDSIFIKRLIANLNDVSYKLSEVTEEQLEIHCEEKPQLIIFFLNYSMYYIVYNKFENLYKSISELKLSNIFIRTTFLEFYYDSYLEYRVHLKSINSAVEDIERLSFLRNCLISLSINKNFKLFLWMEENLWNNEYFFSGAIYLLLSNKLQCAVFTSNEISLLSELQEIMSELYLTYDVCSYKCICDSRAIKIWRKISKSNFFEKNESKINEIIIKLDWLLQERKATIRNLEFKSSEVFHNYIHSRLSSLWNINKETLARLKISDFVSDFELNPEESCSVLFLDKEKVNKMYFNAQKEFSPMPSITDCNAYIVRFFTARCKNFNQRLEFLREFISKFEAQKLKIFKEYLQFLDTPECFVSEYSKQEIAYYFDEMNKNIKSLEKLLIYCENQIQNMNSLIADINDNPILLPLLLYEDYVDENFTNIWLKEKLEFK